MARRICAGIYDLTPTAVLCLVLVCWSLRRPYSCELMTAVCILSPRRHCCSSAQLAAFALAALCQAEIRSRQTTHLYPAHRSSDRDNVRGYTMVNPTTLIAVCRAVLEGKTRATALAQLLAFALAVLPLLIETPAPADPSCHAARPLLTPPSRYSPQRCSGHVSLRGRWGRRWGRCRPQVVLQNTRALHEAGVTALLNAATAALAAEVEQAVPEAS